VSLSHHIHGVTWRCTAVAVNVAVRATELFGLALRYLPSWAGTDRLVNSITARVIAHS
jgi:hypothetical protein